MEEAQDLARAHGLVKLTLSHLECCLSCAETVSYFFSCQTSPSQLGIASLGEPWASWKGGTMWWGK